MKNKPVIAVVAGGDSSEIVVSLRSAQGIYSWIDAQKFTPYVVIIANKEWYVQLNENEKIPVDRNDFSFNEKGQKIKFDFAYITIHGTPGEDGKLQGYFDLIGLPYSCCGVLPAAITANKYTCNHYLQVFGFMISSSIRFTSMDNYSIERIMNEVGLPCFIKPNGGGSSFGTTKVKLLEEISPALEAAFKEGDEVIVEAFMDGTEITCGCYKTKCGLTVLPITEVVPKNEFFDYEAKYTASKCEEITPARLSKEMTKRVQENTAKIYDLLGCKGIIRVDYIIVGEEPYLLEVNTTPGMTATSFIPQQVAVAGLEMPDVLSEIIETELYK